MDIKKYLQEHKFSIYQIVMIQFKYRYYGGFFSKLIETIMAADKINQALLAKAFPTEVHAVYLYKNNEGWWPKTEERLETIQAEKRAKEEKARNASPETGPRLDLNKKGKMIP